MELMVMILCEYDLIVVLEKPTYKFIKYRYITSNGISQQEHGTVLDTDSEIKSLTVYGSYSFTTPDGQTFTVSYIADANGYRVSNLI